MPHQGLDWFIKLEDTFANKAENVGGKAASLNYLICNLTSRGLNVPTGYCLAVNAIHKLLNFSPAHFAFEENELSYQNLIKQISFPSDFILEVNQILKNIAADDQECYVAVRSSAVAEDLQHASFAGRYCSKLMVSDTNGVLEAIKDVLISYFDPRAIEYRLEHGFKTFPLQMGILIQKMIWSPTMVSGVMFTCCPQTGFSGVVQIASSFGLGEGVVSGQITPDEFLVFKKGLLSQQRKSIIGKVCADKKIQFNYDVDKKSIDYAQLDNCFQQTYSLQDSLVQALAIIGCEIEEIYGHAVDIEWAYLPETNKFWILQVRPETIHHSQELVEYQVLEKPKDNHILEGFSVGRRIAYGPVKIISSEEDLKKVVKGDIIVTESTDISWEAVMRIAGGLITEKGGRTCHAAIVAREIGLPAIVGVTGARASLKDIKNISLDCLEDIGKVYLDKIEYQIKHLPKLNTYTQLPIDLYLNIAQPSRAFLYQSLPVQGVGLARMEFLVHQEVKIHPLVLKNYDKLPFDLKKICEKILQSSGYKDPLLYLKAKIQEGLAKIAASFYPRPVTIRFSDFKSNEYRSMIGGDLYEVVEENPMIGFRGVSRYLSNDYRWLFEMECQIINELRLDYGLTNIQVMVPFVRTLKQAKEVIDLMNKSGLISKENGLKILMMCEIPSNVILAKEFLEYFDGYSIGSNDLTQLTLGIDRDAGEESLLADFDEKDLAVKKMIELAIVACHEHRKKISICGQGPSDHLDFAKWLIDQGIDAISINPDKVYEFISFMMSSLKNTNLEKEACLIN